MWKQSMFSHSSKFYKNCPNSKTCKSKGKAMDIGLLSKKNSSCTKIQTCTFPLGQYMCCGSVLSLVQILFSYVFGYGTV